MTKKNIYSKDACIIVKTEKQIYVTILPRVRVGYKAAIIISYPTSASGIIGFVKNAHQILRILPDCICKNNRFQLVFNFEQTRTVTIIGEHGTMASYIT